MPIGNPITLVNRTADRLEFTADGRHFVLNPGENHGFLEGHAKFAMQQNPLMGSEDYYNLEFISLVGVKGHPECPCEPLDADVLSAASEKVERLDRAKSRTPSAKPERATTMRGRGRSVATNALGDRLAVGA